MLRFALFHMYTHLFLSRLVTFVDLLSHSSVSALTEGRRSEEQKRSFKMEYMMIEGGLHEGSLQMYCIHFLLLMLY